MKRYIQFEISKLDGLPITLARRFALSAIAMFPETYYYDNTTGIIGIYCDKLLNTWEQYCTTNEFDTISRSLLRLIDAFKPLLSNLKSRCYNAMTIQDIVRNVVSLAKSQDPCQFIEEIFTYHISFGNNYVKVIWGKSGNIPYKLSPSLFSSIDFMEGIRIFPARQLNVEKNVVRSGFERQIEIGCATYAATVIGATLTFVERIQNVYFFLIPDTLSKDLCIRLKEGVGMLRSLLQRPSRRGRSAQATTSLMDLEEPILLLLLSSAIRAPFGSVSLYSVTGGQRGREAKVSLELTVDFDQLRALREVLAIEDPRGVLTKLVIRTAEAMSSTDKTLQYVGRMFNEALRYLAMLSLGIGDATLSANHVSRVTSDSSLVRAVHHIGDEGQRAVFEWGLAHLRRIAIGVLEVRDALV